MAEMSGPLLTAAEVAALLDVSDRVVRKWLGLPQFAPLVVVQTRQTRTGDRPTRLVSAKLLALLRLHLNQYNEQHRRGYRNMVKMQIRFRLPDGGSMRIEVLCDAENAGRALFVIGEHFSLPALPYEAFAVPLSEQERQEVTGWPADHMQMRLVMRPSDATPLPPFEIPPPSSLPPSASVEMRWTDGKRTVCYSCSSAV